VGFAGSASPSLAVVLLHGFPEGSYAWELMTGPLLRLLGGERTQLVVPNLRGYNASSHPRGEGAYGMERLVQDIQRLVGVVADGGRVRVHLVRACWFVGVVRLFTHTPYPHKVVHSLIFRPRPFRPPT
jgi:pimeloyl-ACP methyl ester carboxylesterase